MTKWFPCFRCFKNEVSVNTYWCGSCCLEQNERYIWETDWGHWREKEQEFCACCDFRLTGAL